MCLLFWLIHSRLTKPIAVLRNEHLKPSWLKEQVQCLPYLLLHCIVFILEVRCVFQITNSVRREENYSFFLLATGINQWVLQNIALLTVSHLAFARSSSNFANSCRSWIVMSSFQISSATKPTSKMAPMTDIKTTRMSGP